MTSQTDLAERIAKRFAETLRRTHGWAAGQDPESMCDANVLMDEAMREETKQSSAMAARLQAESILGRDLEPDPDEIMQTDLVNRAVEAFNRLFPVTPAFEPAPESLRARDAADEARRIALATRLK